MSEEPGRTEAENALEAAMSVASAEQTDEQVEIFLTTLADAELLIPLKSEDLEGAEEGQIALPIFETEERRYVAAFSSVRQMRQFSPQSEQHARITGRELGREWRDDVWLALNPQGEPTAVIPPEQVAELPQRPASEETGSSGRVFMGEPASEPEELLEALRSLLAQRPEVRAGYRAQALFADPGEQPRFVVGLELSGDDTGTFEAAGRVAAEHADGPVDFLTVDPESDEPMGAWMRENTEPFYVADDGQA